MREFGTDTIVRCFFLEEIPSDAPICIYFAPHLFFSLLRGLRAEVPGFSWASVTIDQPEPDFSENLFPSWEIECCITSIFNWALLCEVHQRESSVEKEISSWNLHILVLASFFRNFQKNVVLKLTNHSIWFILTNNGQSGAGIFQTHLQFSLKILNIAMNDVHFRKINANITLLLRKS